MSFRRAVTGAFVAAPLVSIQGASAQPVSAPPVLPPVTVVTDSPREPGDVYAPKRVTAGTKTDTPVVEVPQSVTVIKRGQLTTQNPQSTPQALRYAAGIEPESRGNLAGGADIIYGRGFVLDRYLDGLQLQGGSGFITPQIDIYTLERIEVLRGPASVLYGAASPGGIVNLVSKRPTTSPHQDVFVQAGNRTTFAGGFDVGGPVPGSSTWFYRMTAVGRTADNQVDFSRTQRLSVAPAVTWKPDSDTTIALLLSYQYDPRVGLYNFVPAAGSLLPNANGSLPRRFFAGDPGFNEYSRNQYSAGYQAEHRINDVFTVRQNVRYLHADGKLKQVLPDFLLPDDRTLSRLAARDKESVGTVSVDTQLQSTFATGGLLHRLLTGVDYQRTRFDQSTDVGFNVPPLDIFAPIYHVPIGALDFPFVNVRQTQDQAGIYAQDQMRIDRWAFLIGLRHDWAKGVTRDDLAATTTKQTDHKLSWRAGMVYLFDNGIAPYASYSTSFQPTSGVTAAGAPFKPTTARQYEVGVKYQPPGKDSFVMLSFYRISQQNALTTDPNNPLFQVQSGEISSRGVEFSAVVVPLDGLNIVGAVSFNKPEITRDNSGNTGNRPAFVPKTLASLWADYTIQAGPLAGLQFGAGVRHVGSTFADSANSLRVPGYTLFDGMLAYRLSGLGPHLDGWRAALNVTNIFNKKYVSECSGQANCLYGVGTTVLMTLGKTF